MGAEALVDAFLNPPDPFCPRCDVEVVYECYFTHGYYHCYACGWRASDPVFKPKPSDNDSNAGAS